MPLDLRKEAYKMPPEVCAAHGPLMENIGALKAQQKNTADDVCEIKQILLRWEAESKTEAIAAAEQKAKNKVVWGALGTAAVTGISAGVHFIIKKVMG